MKRINITLALMSALLFISTSYAQVTFTAINDLCLNLGPQTGSGSGIPAGGTYSGTGIIDDGNGLSYSFDPAIAGAGVHTVVYSLGANSASDDIEVFDLPMVSFTAINDLCLNLGPQTGSGTGIPVGGIYSGPSITDDGNGLSYSFDPIDAGAGIHIIQYEYTDANGCTEIATDNVEVFGTPVLTISDCACDYDSDFNNYGSQVTITLNSGLAPYTLSTTYGTLSETTLVDNQPSVLKLGPDGGSYTLTVTDANGCVITRNSSCGGCDFVFDITDPCACNNDQSYNGAQDGTFGEVVEVTGATGLDLVVGTGSIGLNGINVGDSFTEELPGVYRLRFDHVDLIGYTIYVEGRFGNVTFPVLDTNGNQLSSSNACQYPVISEPQLDQDDFCFNGAPLVFTGNEVSEINGFAGDVQVYLGNVISGAPISEFDPNLYSSGLYTLTFLFIGDFIDNIGGTSVDPAFPGCQTTTTIQVGVNGGETLACNDQVNMSVNANCELDFSFYALLESDAVPNIFNAEFYTADGVEINENDLGSYAGNIISYSIFDLCNGNSCWGTINIEDKTDPVINCEICPVIDGINATEYDTDCVITCYEQPILQLKYDAKLRDKLVPEDIEDFVTEAMSDNCNNWNDNEVSYIDKYEDLGECIGARLTRTWTVGFDKSDGSKGSVSCSRQYFVNPLSLSTITEYEKDEFTGKPIIRPIKDSLVLPPDLIELPCGQDISPEGLVAYFDNPLTLDLDSNDNNVDPDEWDVDLIVENNEGYAWAYPHYYMHGVGSGGPHAQKIVYEVCTIVAGYTDTEIDACNPGCDGNKKILREWVILDWCNAEYVEHSQIIKSIDTSEPTITVEDITLSVDPWTCSVDAKLPMPEHIIDDCANITTYYLGFTGGYDVIGDSIIGYTVLGLPLGRHTIEYLAEDCCGNVGSTTIFVDVVDLTPPVAVSKEFIVISLTNLGNPVDEFQGIAKIYAKDIDNGSYDGCSEVTLEIRRSPVCNQEDAEWGPFVSFCCEDLEGATSVEIDVELRITDENGNSNLVWSTILLEDKSSSVPVIPPHMYLTCDMDFNDFNFTGGLPRIYGACGEAQVSCDTAMVIANTEPRELRLSDGVYIGGVLQEAPAYDPACGYGAIRRQFKDCGNGVQWFVILQVDPFDPTSIVFPSDTVVDCDNYDLDQPSWELATCGLIGVSLESDTFAFEDGACLKILNHWTVINWCAYDPTDIMGRGKFEHTQVVKIIDTHDPVLTVVDSLCFAVDIDCTSKGIIMSASAIDAGDCGSQWISWQVNIDLNADWTEDYNYASTNPKRLANGDLNPFHLPKTGNGEEVYLELPDGIPNSKIWHRSIWRAFDGCGNTVSSSRYFQIVDKKAPTPYCLNLSTAVMTNGEVELWAIDFNVGSFDNCSNSENLLYTFTDVAPPSRNDAEYDSNDDLLWYDGSYWYYNSDQIDPVTGAGEYEKQDDFGDSVHRWEPGLRSSGAIFKAEDADSDGFIQLPIYAWDECGNRDFCLVNLRIVDNGGGGMAMVSGHVFTELGKEVDQVLTNLKGPSNFNNTDMTDETGTYAFPNTPLYADYLVSGMKTDDYLNGVSTLDLVLIQRHILGQTYLDSPYKMIAADINKDNQVSTLDLLELRKLILGIYTELPNNGSWTLVNSDNNLTVESPWNYEESISISDLNQDMYSEDFIGVKIGDVNGNVIANAQSTSIVSRSNNIEINYEDKVMEIGEVVELTLSTDRTDVYGYQFTLNTPGLELTEIVGDVKSNNIGVFNNMLTVSYNANEVLASDNLLTIRLKATQAGQLSEMLTMGSEVTSAEAYVGSDLEVVSIDLTKNTETIFELYQNEPNPFNEYTVIGFNMPKSGEATLTMYDVTGKTLKVIEGNYAQGNNSVSISSNDLGVAGMIYYKLQTGEFTATKHMVVIQ